MYLQIRNTTISRINIYIYNPYIHIIHILLVFYLNLPKPFHLKCCSSVQILQAVFPVFTFRPSRLVVHEGTNHMQPKGAMWLAALPPFDLALHPGLGLHPLTLDYTPWPWIRPDETWIGHGIFDHQRAYWFQEACYVWFMFLLTNHRHQIQKKLVLLAKSTCLCTKNSCEA